MQPEVDLKPEVTITIASGHKISDTGQHLCHKSSMLGNFICMNHLFSPTNYKCMVQYAIINFSGERGRMDMQLVT